VGPLDDAFASLRAAVIDLAQRCLARGLLNIVADDVFVPSVLPGLPAHGGPLSVGEDRPLLEKRYAYLADALGEEVSRPLSSAVAAARRLARRTSVTVDARILRGSHSGAQTETLQLIETLAGAEAVDVRVLVDPEAGDALRPLDRIGGIERLPADAVLEASPSDVVHRPYQVTSVEDLDVLARVGGRLVLNHLDLIAYHNASYFGSFESWRQFRRVTGLALAIADRVIFRTEHAARDAIGEGLVARDRIDVIPLGLDSAFEPGNGNRPEGTPEAPFLFCVGNDFRHKNRVFALRLLEALHDRGWNGHLVLAGADVGLGSSRGDEAEYLARHGLSATVHDLPALGSGELRWLYANAAAVVYPTVYEGFGLIPFEAAQAGTPCLFAAQASMAETLPSAAATLVPWSAPLSAERVLPLLEESTERARHIELVGDAARALGDRTAITARLLDVYEAALRQPLRETALLAKEGLAREAQLAKWVGLEENMGPLVGPDAYLPPDVQRALLAAATRPRLRRPLFGALRLLYRAGRRGRSAGDG
jgi:glycosyltransferase involved in cell wall biosynthesis